MWIFHDLKVPVHRDKGIYRKFSWPGCLLWAAGPELHYVDICPLFNPLMPYWAGNWNCVIATSLTRWGKTLSQVDEGFVVTALLPQWAWCRFLAGRRSLSLCLESHWIRPKVCRLLTGTQSLVSGGASAAHAEICLSLIVSLCYIFSSFLLVCFYVLSTEGYVNLLLL